MRALKKPFYLSVLDNLHMKTTISIYKSRFSLTRNVFFNNFFFYNPLEYKCSWIKVIVLAPHLHPEPVEGCNIAYGRLRRAQPPKLSIHRTCILSLSKDVEGCNIVYWMASTSSAAKIKHTPHLHPEPVMEKSYFNKECVFQHPRLLMLDFQC